MKNFSRLKEIVDTLLGPNGCPWDRKQTFESLRPSLEKEVDEVMKAIESEDHDNLKEELGDILINVMLYCGIAEKRELFTVDDVLGGLCDKLIHRHPHVFGDEKAATPEEAHAIWKRQKGVDKKGSLA